MGQYALMADISKCFFQMLLPEEQQDLFQILWFKDDDIQKGEHKMYKFSRHVWAIISSPYIACAAIRKTAEAKYHQCIASHNRNSVKPHVHG